ncbi:MAG: hypothetical protein AAGJ82_13095, partial [Bacteroidota bacterium]
TFHLNERWYFRQELLFRQNGEYILPAFYPQIEYGAIRLDHVELPLSIERRLVLRRRAVDRMVSLGLGVAYTRLLRAEIADAEGRDVTESVIYEERDNWLLQTTIGYSFTRRFGIGLRLSWPVFTQGLGTTAAVRLQYVW